MRRTIAHLALLICVPALLAADPLKETLAAMDAASESFRSVKAKVRKASYTAVIDDETIEIGTMAMERKGGASKGVRVRMDFTEPDVRSVAFAGKKGEIYYPKIKTVHEYDLGKHRELVESFLLLGFGTTGKQLAKDYSIEYLGKADVNSVATEMMALTPKSKKAREQIAKVEIWIAKEGAYPIQQKFYSPSDDSNTISYSEITLNPELTDKDLALDLPAGVKREYPQK